MSSSAALLLLGVLVAFTAATARGRGAFATDEPWIAGIALAVVLVLHVIWLQGVWPAGPGDNLLPLFERLRQAQSASLNTSAWLRLLAALGTNDR